MGKNEKFFDKLNGKKRKVRGKGKQKLTTGVLKIQKSTSTSQDGLHDL